MNCLVVSTVSQNWAYAKLFGNQRLTEEALGPACLLFDPAYKTSGRIALALGEMQIAGPMTER